MKTLLIKPPYTRLKGTGQAPYFPLGIAYIAGVLNRNGFETLIYQAENPAPGEKAFALEAAAEFANRSQGQLQVHKAIEDPEHPAWAELRQVLRQEKPDLVGVTLLSVEVPSARHVTRIVKEELPDSIVVWGGVHPTFMPESCLENPEVDAVSVGEGEFTFLDLCRALTEGRDWHQVDGLVFKQNGEIVRTTPRTPITDLDTLAIPDRQAVLFPERCNFQSLGSMIISRGCPFRCTFCSSRNFWDKKVRFRSPENVVEEIRTLKEQFGCSHIMFWDDTLTFSESTVRKYCDAIIDSGLRVTWKAATRADMLNPDLVKHLRRAGCVKMEIGVESGSERIRKLIKKDVDDEQIHYAFDLLRKNGIGSGAFFMAGFPEETVEDIQETWALMKDLDIDEMAFNIFDPMPGSDEYDKCIEMGLVPKDADWNDFPFWPDAHYVRDIDPETFCNLVVEIADWLFKHNNSLAHRFRRNRRLALMMLRNNPRLLLSKILARLRPRGQSS